MRFAVILDDKAHWVFEQDAPPDFGPDPTGKPIEWANITDTMCEEGYLYNREVETFTPPEAPAPEEE